MLRLEVLGTPALTRDGRETVRSVLARPKEFALLAYLASQPASRHRRDSLFALLWPELDHHRARKALRQSLYGLRRSLAPHTIGSLGKELIGVDPEHVRCDAAEFGALVSSGAEAAALDL